LTGDNMSVAMMNGQSSTSARGDGWVGASKNYVGDLVAQFVLPDTDRFDEIAALLPEAFAELSKPNNNGTDFAMPRFETRLNTTLDETLKAQGLTAPYSPGGLTGIADDARLVIDKVAHETYVAFDEDGTEAAAATVILIMPVSATRPLHPSPTSGTEPGGDDATGGTGDDVGGAAGDSSPAAGD
jgi:serpin B